MTSMRSRRGLEKEDFVISEAALKDIVSSYTMEAGVRSLDRELSKVARKIATELAEAFHAFYNAQRVLGVEENVMRSRILLMEAARVTLKNALGILGVSAPEKM